MLRLYAATLGSNGLIFVVNTISSILLARILGPTVLGEYALVSATYTMLVNVAGMGLNVSNSTMAANDRETVDALATHSLLLAVGFGMVPILAYLAARPWLDATLFSATPPGLLLIGLAAVPCALFSGYFGSLMVGMHEIGLLNRLNLVGSLVTTTVQLGVVAFVQQDAYAVLGTMLLGALAMDVAMVAVLFVRHRWRPRVDRALLRESLSLGLRSHLGNLANYVFLRLDYYVVSAFAGPTALGYYSLATSLAEKLWMAVQPIYSVAFSRIAAGAEEQATKLTEQMTRVALWTLLLLGAVLSLAATFLLPIVYGDRFAPTLGPLYLLLPGTALFGGSWFLGLYFTGRLRRPETPSKIAWAACAASVPLYLGLTLALGIRGAALASSVTYAIVFVGTLIAYARSVGIPVGKIVPPQPEDWQVMRIYLRRGLTLLHLRREVSPST